MFSPFDQKPGNNVGFQFKFSLQIYMKPPVNMVYCWRRNTRLKCVRMFQNQKETEKLKIFANLENDFKF